MWQKEATDWLRSVFPDSARFDVEIHRERVWGTIWKVHVDDGLHWFKAGHPALRREVRLRRVLREFAPEEMLACVADEPTTGWMVTEDQGPTLATRGREEGPQHWVELAATLGRLQRALPHDVLAQLDLPTFHPSDALARLDEALAWFAGLPQGHPCHLETSRRTRALTAMEGVVERWAAVAPSGIPELGIDHNDLHAGNAYPGPRISDWGDAVIAHPFSSLRPLWFATASTFGDEVGIEVRRAYLAQWGDPDALDEVLAIAIELAVPQRLLCWHLLDEPDLVAEYARYVRPLWEEIGRPITQP